MAAAMTGREVFLYQKEQPEESLCKMAIPPIKAMATHKTK